MWGLTIACQPYRRRRDQKDVIRAAQAVAGLQSWKSPYEMVAPEERVRMIGVALVTGGERWRRGHRQQLRWLAAQGLTEQDAIDHYTAWFAEQADDPFWNR